MRYEARWNNGFWKLFDTQNYADVEIFYTKKELDAAVEQANARRR